MSGYNAVILEYTVSCESLQGSSRSKTQCKTKVAIKKKTDKAWGRNMANSSRTASSFTRYCDRRYACNPGAIG